MYDTYLEIHMWCIRKEDVLHGIFQHLRCSSLFYRSGVDEDFTEKDALLTEVLQLIEEEKTKEKEFKCEKNKEEETAKAMRKRAMEGMSKGML